MNIKHTVALSVLAGFGLGAIAVQTLHAQAKPPAYSIVEIDVTNQDGFMKEFAPLASKAIEAGGAKYLARGGKTVTIEGEAPKSRVIVQAWENIDKAQAAFASDAYKDARKIGDKYAKFRIFAIEGVAP